MSTGRKSIAFMNSTSTNIVSAIGATRRVVAVVDALDLLVDEVDRQLDERLRLRRHARRRLARDQPHEAERQHAEDERSSAACRHCSVQKPPSPTGCVRNVRWCWMYSVGVAYEAAIGGFGRENRQSRTNKATRNSNTVTMKAASNAGRTTSPYVASTSQSWPMITRIFAASARNSATTVAPGRLARRDREHERIHDARRHVDHAAQHRGQRAMHAGPQARDRGDDQCRRRLPDEHGPKRPRGKRRSHGWRQPANRLHDGRPANRHAKSAILTAFAQLRNGCCSAAQASRAVPTRRACPECDVAIRQPPESAATIISVAPGRDRRAQVARRVAARRTA